MEAKFLVLQSIHHVSLVEWTLQHSKKLKTDLFSFLRASNVQKQEHSKPYTILMKPYDLIRTPCHTFEGLKMTSCFGICPSIKQSLQPVQACRAYQDLINCLMQEKKRSREEIKKYSFLPMSVFMFLMSRVWYTESKRYGDKSGSANDGNLKKESELKKEKIEKLKDKLKGNPDVAKEDFPRYK